VNKWKCKSRKLSFGKISGFKIYEDKKLLTFNDFLRLLVESKEFRAFFNELLSSSKYSAYRWETPSVSQNSLNKDFSFVLVNSPGLIRKIDRISFQEHFTKSDSIVVSPNLSGDATMIIPTPGTDGMEYGHLADFVRKAPQQIIHQFWKKVGEEMLLGLQKRKCWLSTAGAGVSWLHLRIDSKPKYYTYAPFRNS